MVKIDYNFAEIGKTALAQMDITRLQEDPKISHFVINTVIEGGCAPHAAAGIARRTPTGWVLRGGAESSAGLTRLFDLASISKPFLALLCARLVRLGLLAWRTPLDELLPALRGTFGGARCVEELLSHRAGLMPHIELYRSIWSGEALNREQCLLRAARAQSVSAHSTGPWPALYSDLGYILLGEGLMARFEKPLDHLLWQYVTRDLGLSISSARCFRAYCPQLVERVAHTEIQPARGGLLSAQVHDDNAWALRGSALCGHAGLFGQLEALLKLGCTLLEGRNSSEWAPLLEKKQAGTLRMGFDGVAGEKSAAGALASPETFGHLGFTGTSIWCDPKSDKVAVFLTNRVFPRRDRLGIRAIRPKMSDFLWSY